MFGRPRPWSLSQSTEAESGSARVRTSLNLALTEGVRRENNLKKKFRTPRLHRDAVDVDRMIPKRFPNAGPPLVQVVEIQNKPLDYWPAPPSPNNQTFILENSL